MASNLRVDQILPSTSTNVAIGTATGSVTLVGSVSGTSITNSGVTAVAAGSASAPSITPTGDSNTGIFFPSADTIAFAEGGVEALRITSASRVGLGTNIPDSYDSGARTLVIDESGSLAGMTIRSSTQGAVYFADGLTGNEAYRGRIEYSHSTDALNFGTAGTGSKLSLTSGGNVEIANGNLVFSTSGKGIDFSATANSSGTMTSELLDDYETGTWTATFSATGASFTYNHQIGTYVKIGNTVFVTCMISPATITGASGVQLFVNGLPFAPRTVNSQNIFGVNIARTNNWNTAPVGGQFFPTTIELYKYSGTNVVDLLCNDATNGCIVRFNGFYEV
jgi:hypothetical protein